MSLSCRLLHGEEPQDNANGVASSSASDTVVCDHGLEGAVVPGLTVLCRVVSSCTSNVFLNSSLLEAYEPLRREPYS